MVTDDQRAIIDLLGSPSTHGGAAVERIETHASVVFLAGDRAWKLKRAVRYDYLDFSSAERRRAMCEAEVQLNRRTAPQLYRGVVAVTRRADGSLALGGAGTPVDWVVSMNRFDQDQLLDRLASRGALALQAMEPLAQHIAAFHAAATPRPDHGGADAMNWVVSGNATGLAEFGGGTIDRDACARITDESRALVARHAAALDSRRRAGFVRQCHGDLHLRNIVVLEDRPTLFDAVEFNDALACIDVFYDLSFLLMDLWRRGLPRHANAVFNRYLTITGDRGALVLLPLFLSCRAAIRAKTSATAASAQSDPVRRGELERLARDYVAMAERLLHPSPPMLVAVGGLSGSGKTTIARRVAAEIGAVPGAVVVRTDELRKELLGRSPLDRLGPDAYSAQVSERVYARLADRAAEVLRAGHSVVADAVCARPDDRARLEAAAAAAAAPFAGLWLHAPETVLMARVAGRRGDASDADAEVVQRQLREPTGPITWHTIEADRPEDVVARDAARRALTAEGV